MLKVRAKGWDTMDCPYCKEDMHEGVIHGDRYSTKWVPKEKDRGGIFQWFSRGIILANMAEDVEPVYYCEKCEKIIIDTKGKIDTRK